MFSCSPRVASLSSTRNLLPHDDKLSWPPWLPVWIHGIKTGIHPELDHRLRNPIPLMALSRKRQNAFLFRMQKTHIKSTKVPKMFITPQMRCPLYAYLKFFTYSVIFFLHKGVGNVSYDPCLLFKFPSIVQKPQASVQAAW